MQHVDPQFYVLYDKLMQKHAKAFEKMSSPDKIAFKRRLCTMAYRELFPHCNDFFLQSYAEALSKKEDFNEPLRIRATRIR